MKKGNAKALDEAAHNLKGSFGYIGASSLGQLAFQLEQIGKSGRVSGHGEPLAKLEAGMTQLEAALAEENVAHLIGKP